MELLKYPFSSDELLRKKKSIKKTLNPENAIKKKIAILGGSTTALIREMLEIFLLYHGIAPEFYESEYNQYWQDAMFSQELVEFSPEIIFIHTTSRNLNISLHLQATKDEAEEMVQKEYSRFEQMWETLYNKFHATVIQNNFERSVIRLMGNQDVALCSGFSNAIASINSLFYGFASEHSWFLIHDIDYLAADFGLSAWADSSSWHMAKMVPSASAVPAFAYNLSCVIKSLLGKNKKVLALDLDNTLWGGIVGEEGADSLALGPETAEGAVFSEFQGYLKAHKDLGVLLTVLSKNDDENALSGLNHPDSMLSPKDFVAIRANWNQKDANLRSIAAELSLGEDSFVFVDDNPAERALVYAQVPGVAVPELDNPENYMRILNRAGYFEVTSLSEDDISRNRMYADNAARQKHEAQFTSYGDFLQSLEMRAVIADFEPVLLDRITQLTNKSNQFNLTTRRYTLPEMTAIATNPEYIRLYGRLADRFGDNGVVSVVIGKKDGKKLDILLWLMSCRVLKRGMEHAMLDSLCAKCMSQGIEKLRGTYIPTTKNSMVRDFYRDQGFESNGNDGDTTFWLYNVEKHKKKNEYIQVISSGKERT